MKMPEPMETRWPDSQKGWDFGPDQGIFPFQALHFLLKRLNLFIQGLQVIWKDQTLPQVNSDQK